MVNNCSNKDINKIIELGKLLNDNFDKVNDIDSIINNKEVIGYYYKDELVGFIIFKKIYEVIDLLYIVVDVRYRNIGVGSNLLKYLIKNYDYEKIMLEVSSDNINAISLYNKNGFKNINIRKNYYGSSDAYVMELIK